MTCCNYTDLAQHTSLFENADRKSQQPIIKSFQTLLLHFSIILWCLFYRTLLSWVMVTKKYYQVTKKYYQPDRVHA